MAEGDPACIRSPSSGNVRGDRLRCCPAFGFHGLELFPYRLRFGDELRVRGSRGALHGLAQLNEVVRERLEDVQPFSYHKHGDVKVLLESVLEKIHGSAPG